ncbi:MAG: glycosyltransferase family 39 protein [Candidatus Eisenbacteria bacterium]
MIAVGLATSIAAAVLSSTIFGRMPHVQDSIAQLFQARIFAMGRLWAPSPPLREFFDYAHMVNDGRWYSQYPPGHALLLVPGVWLGAPWLVNPLLAGLGVAATYLLARVSFDRTTARVSTLLGLASPFLLFMAAEFMSHVSGFFLLTAFLAFFVLALRAGRARYRMAAAVFLALAVLTRPYTAIALALPALLWAVGHWRTARSRESARALWIVPGGIAAGMLLYALYNWGTTGDPLLPGYVKLYGPAHGIGFGKGSWGRPHTLSIGLKHAWEVLGSLNGHLFQWPVTSVWPILLALLPPLAVLRQIRWGPRSARVHWRRAWLFAAFPLAVLTAHLFYWYYDFCFGPRYLYDALGPLLIVSGWGVVRAARWIGRVWDVRGAAAVLGVVVLALFLYAGLVRWPRLIQPPAEAASAPPGSAARVVSYFRNYTPEYWGVSPYLGRLVEREGLRHALVFVRFTGQRSDVLPVRHMWFGSAFAHQQPDLGNARVIYAQDRGPENVKLARLFPDRTHYLYTGNIEEGRILKLAPPERER